jgi:hypothetical protein
MENKNKYKIEVKWDRWNGPKKEIIPLPEEKVTGISWSDLVKIISESGVEIVDQIRLHNIGEEGGTNMLTRNELFELWRDVEKYRCKTKSN